MNENQVIRRVLIEKFDDSRQTFNETLYVLLLDSRKWVEDALLFKVPKEVKRTSVKTWNTSGVFDLDTIVRCNFELDDRVVSKLLEIQPIEFWSFYLVMPKYESALNCVYSLKYFEQFLTEFSKRKFPNYDLENLKEYTDMIFLKMRSEDFVSTLRECQFEMFLVEKSGNNMMQLNMMNILLYSMIFRLDYHEVATICTLICNLIVHIEQGRDSDKESADLLTMKKWNDNGNWGRVINYYLYKAIEENNHLFDGIKLRSCLNFLINQDGFILFPFQFRVVALEHLSKFKNEKMREQLNNLRRMSNSNELIVLNS